MIHLFRALELETPLDATLMNLKDVVGEFPYRAPSVFNFFQQDYQPDGALKMASLVAPEALALSGPNIVNYMNGMFSSIQFGLTSCFGGFGKGFRQTEDRPQCAYLRPDNASQYYELGGLSYTPGGESSTVLDPPESARSYSSVYNDDQIGHGYAASMLSAPGGWSPSTSQAGEWIDIDLGFNHQVIGVVIKARGDADQYVTEIAVLYSADVVSGDAAVYAAVQSDSLFAIGDTGGNARITFPQVMARRVRLVAQGYYGRMSLRAGVVVAHGSLPKSKTFTHFDANYSNAAEVVTELDVLLTGGRLGAETRGVIEAAFTASMSDGYQSAALRVAEQLMVVAPEFQITGGNPSTDDPVSLPKRTRPVTPAEQRRPYKAVVYFYMSGGADSFNMLVPYDGCGGTDMFAQYYAIRAEQALSKQSLLPVTAKAISKHSTQVCDRFGLHPATPALQRLFNAGDAMFIANAGALDVPLTKAEYVAKLKPQPSQLFAHNTQTRFAQNVDARTSTRGNGVLGRMLDALSSSSVQTGSYSINGAGATVLQPVDSAPFDVLSVSGSPKLDAQHLSLMADIANLTDQPSRSPFANTWSSRVSSTLDRTAVLNDALDKVTLEQTFQAETHHLG